MRQIFVVSEIVITKGIYDYNEIIDVVFSESKAAKIARDRHENRIRTYATNGFKYQDFIDSDNDSEIQFDTVLEDGTRYIILVNRTSIDEIAPLDAAIDAYNTEKTNDNAIMVVTNYLETRDNKYLSMSSVPLCFNFKNTEDYIEDMYIDARGLVIIDYVNVETKKNGSFELNDCDTTNEPFEIADFIISNLDTLNK